MTKNFTQDFVTSRRNYNDGDSRIGQIGRLWYDSATNTIRISDGVTPGGIIVSADSVGSAITIKDEGIVVTEVASSLNFVGNGVDVSHDSSGDVTVNVTVPTAVYDGGTPSTDYSVGIIINAGGVV